MATDLLSQIVPPSVDHQEVLQVISAHFGGATSTHEFDVQFPANGPHALRVRTKQNEIVRIDAGPACEEQLIAALREAVHSKLVESQEQFIAAKIFFSSKPVRGSFRCEDPEVQIIEAPPEAPRPSLQIGDQPFVLEFPCSRCPDLVISAFRRWKLVREWADILNVVLNPRIVRPDMQTRFSWVLSDPGPPREVRFAQHCYAVPGFTGAREAFSEPTDPIPSVSQQKYYTQPDAVYGGNFAIPDNLAQTLHRISHLPESSRKRFFQAARWLAIAYDPWEPHKSCQYIAAVAAIESLMPNVSGGPKCPECHRDTGPGPTERFRQFLDEHVPSDSNMRKTARTLYQVRSGLAHGKHLLVSDDEPSNRFDTSSLREWQSIWELHQVSRIAIINWLNAQEVA